MMGTVGIAPALEDVVVRFPILERLVPIEFESGYWESINCLDITGCERCRGSI